MNSWSKSLRTALVVLGFLTLVQSKSSLQNAQFVYNNICTGQSNGPIRLWRNGITSPTYNSGRVQVFVNGQWGNICRGTSGSSAARVICRQLGFSRLFTHNIALYDG